MAALFNRPREPIDDGNLRLLRSAPKKAIAGIPAYRSTKCRVGFPRNLITPRLSPVRHLKFADELEVCESSLNAVNGISLLFTTKSQGKRVEIERAVRSFHWKQLSNWASEKDRKSSMIRFACLTEITGGVMRNACTASDRAAFGPGTASSTAKKARGEFPACRRPKPLHRRLCGNPRSLS